MYIYKYELQNSVIKEQEFLDFLEAVRYCGSHSRENSVIDPKVIDMDNKVIFVPARLY